MSQVLTYNGFEYRPFVICGYMVDKINHVCYFNGREVTMTPAFYDHTPYSFITADEFMCYVHDAEAAGVDTGSEFDGV